MPIRFEATVSALSRRGANGASFCPPLEGTTFRVRFTTYELAQTYLNAARKYAEVSKHRRAGSTRHNVPQV